MSPTKFITQLYIILNVIMYADIKYTYHLYNILLFSMLQVLFP